MASLSSKFKTIVSTVVWTTRDNLASISKAQMSTEVDNVGQFAFNVISSSRDCNG